MSGLKHHPVTIIGAGVAGLYPQRSRLTKQFALR